MRTPIPSRVGGTWLGIDPGLDGYVAVLLARDVRPPLVAHVYKTPVFTITKRSGRGTVRRYNLQGMQEILARYSGATLAALEELSGRPGQSSQAVFGMGRGFGIWEALLAAAKIPMIAVPPMTWKKKLGVTRKPGQDDKAAKAESVLKAQQLFPHEDFSKVIYHNKADALLLAEYARVHGTG